MLHRKIRASAYVLVGYHEEELNLVSFIVYPMVYVRVSITLFCICSCFNNYYALVYGATQLLNNQEDTVSD